MTTLGQDTFIRANVSSPSWGTATDTQTWAHAAGSATTYSVTSDEGVIANTPGLWDQFLLGSTTSGPQNVIVRSTTAVTSENFGVILRANSTSTTGYFCLFDGGAGKIEIYRNNSGITSIGSFTFSTTANDSYWVRGTAIGSTITCAVWLDGNAEPSPQVSVTDATYTSGQFGVIGKASSNLKFDHFTATDTTSTQVDKDISSRFYLTAQVDKDISTRYRLAAQIDKDISSRFYLAAQVDKDIATRFGLAVPGTQVDKDIATRFGLVASGTLTDKDIATRFGLLAVQSRDISTRFGLSSSQQQSGFIQLLGSGFQNSLIEEL